MNRYKNTTIYKIYSENVSDFYIGHTTLKLSRRYSVHKYYANKKKSKLYTFIKNNGGFENFKIEILETFSCDNVREARQKERDYILLYKPTLNNNIPLRDYREWRKESKKYKDYMRAYMKKYYYKSRD